MEGIPPHKRAGANRCIRHPTPLSAAARAGYECAQVPAYRRHAHRRSSQRAKAMAQTVREKALIRQAREDGRPSEDDVAQERLGWRGQKGRPRPAMMTEESKKETSRDLDPGHTS
jgi:hypothetical protein